MIRVLIDEDTLLEQFVERIKFWSDDEDVIALYTAMYERYIDGGIFDDTEVNIMEIVDNDYVNWCDVLSEGEEYYDEVHKNYLKNGLGDCSCEIDGVSYIEAEYNGYYLIRR
jgi:hypothetical protein